MRKSTKAALAGLALLAVAGCSTANIGPDQAGLHYEAGAWSDTKFANCIPPSTKINADGPGDKHYAYPAGQRTLSFTGKPGSEEEPLKVTTSDGQEVHVPGFLTFHLNTTDCEALRQFHEQIGLKYKAYMDGESTSDGWVAMLEDYVFTPLSNISNTSAEEYGWQQLYNDSASVKEMSGDILDNLQGQVDTAMGGHYLTIEQVTLGRPDISDALKAGNTEIQRAKLDQQAQLQRNRVYHDKYDTFADCQKVLSQENCLLFYAIEKGSITVVPVPNGTGLNITP